MQVDKLREIILKQAYSNFPNTLYFPLIMVLISEEAHVLPQEQYGFRIGHTKIDLEMTRMNLLVL